MEFSLTAAQAERHRRIRECAERSLNDDLRDALGSLYSGTAEMQRQILARWMEL
jgi:hypothetical protein